MEALELPVSVRSCRGQRSTLAHMKQVMVESDKPVISGQLFRAR